MNANLDVVHNNGSLSLVNTNKLDVSLVTKGASIHRVSAPDRDGNFQNIALTLHHIHYYGQDPSYAGATLGPSAGRICGGRLLLDGAPLQLSRNEGQNHLHGGKCGFSQMDWDLLDSGVRDGCARAVFGITVRDGLDGYPGFRRVRAEYRLDDRNRLTIRYTATSDKPTWFNLSSHAYWNLSGDFAAGAQDHQLQIAAGQYWRNRADFCPEGQFPVAGTPFDFRAPVRVGQRLQCAAEDPQLRGAAGFNHYFLLNENPAAVLSHTGSGRRLKIWTDCPALVFYSGGLLGGGTVLEGGLPATPGCALALEPQERPLDPDGARAAAVPPGQVWQRTLQYGFDTF